jgi:hypothetical protein
MTGDGGTELDVAIPVAIEVRQSGRGVSTKGEA